jgi:hypothetical protein
MGEAQNMSRLFRERLTRLDSIEDIAKFFEIARNPDENVWLYHLRICEAIDALIAQLHSLKAYWNVLPPSSGGLNDRQ